MRSHVEAAADTCGRPGCEHIRQHYQRARPWTGRSANESSTPSVPYAAKVAIEL